MVNYVHSDFFYDKKPCEKPLTEILFVTLNFSLSSFDFLPVYLHDCGRYILEDGSVALVFTSICFHIDTSGTRRSIHNSKYHSFSPLCFRKNNRGDNRVAALVFIYKNMCLPLCSESCVSNSSLNMRLIQDRFVSSIHR